MAEQKYLNYLTNPDKRPQGFYREGNSPPAIAPLIPRGPQPKVPLAPPGVSIDENIREAQRLHDPMWFYNQVRNGGPWDYKQQGPQYEAFGNFNYAATGKAAGYPEEVLRRMAGWAQQRAGTSKPEWSNPLSGRPYGDDPADQAQIEPGFKYRPVSGW